MTDPNPQSEQNQTPEDVATLYSWANLHGAKYRDFSASRALTREKARLRAEQALGEEQGNSEAAVKAAEAAEEERMAEQARAAEAAARQAEQEAEQARQQQEAARQQAIREEEARQAAHAAALEEARQQAAAEAARQAEEQAAQQAAEEAARQEAARLEAEHAAREKAEQAARREADQARERATQLALQRAREEAAQQAMHEAALQAQAAKEALAAKQAAQQAAEQQQEAQRAAAEQPAAERRGWQPWTDRYAAAVASSQAYPPAPAPTQSFEHPAFTRQQQGGPAPVFGASRDEAPAEARSPWATAEGREPAGRPAWLSAGNFEAAAAPAPANAPEDTLQGSRDRLTSRWFALRGVFDPSTPPAPEPAPLPVASRAPALAVFSLAGGVGKTSLVATLGRALSARGERVLLVDTAAFGLLPFFFGATDQRPGQLRTFLPPGVAGDAPVQMVTLDADGLAPDQSGQESLSGEIARFARGASRVIVDLATASGATTRRILRMSPLVLVPVVADMNSVVSVSSIDAFFEHNSMQSGKTTLPYYVLNQFDSTLPLHLDVREVLREQLGERLLPFALRRTSAMSEALAEGMTVIDYAPGSTLAEDFVTLAGWLKSLSAPATASYRGVRWSER